MTTSLAAAMELYRAGRTSEALFAIEQILMNEPRHAGLLNNKGIFANRLGDLRLAEESFRQAIEIKPDYAEAWNNLGNLLSTVARWSEAEAAYRAAVVARPTYVNALVGLGQVLLHDARLADAEFFINQALAFGPNHVPALVNLSAVHLSSRNFTKAATACRLALSIDPNRVAAYANLGLALMNLNCATDAEAAFRDALRLSPTDSKVSENLALLLLAQGRYDEGWKAFELRLGHNVHEKSDSTHVVELFTKPTAINLPRLWRGEDLGGKSVLAWSEGGFGDEIQFVRYLPRLGSQGLRHLTLACKQETKPLFELQGFADRVICKEDWQSPMADDFDVWCPLLSLPLRFGTTLDSIPASLPYLTPAPGRIAKWKPRLGAPGLRVGLVWRGNPRHENDTARSLPSLATLAPLWSVPGIHFVSLQKGEGESEARAPQPNQPLIHLGTDIADFADTAAIVSMLDLVISVDTSTVHLAAASGTATWVMLPLLGTDWRWLLDREDSPWYPGVLRLFRQDRAGDWEGVVSRLAAALHEWVKARSE